MSAALPTPPAVGTKGQVRISGRWYAVTVHRHYNLWPRKKGAEPVAWVMFVLDEPTHLGQVKGEPCSFRVASLPKKFRTVAL